MSKAGIAIAIIYFFDQLTALKSYLKILLPLQWRGKLVIRQNLQSLCSQPPDEIQIIRCKLRLDLLRWLHYGCSFCWKGYEYRYVLERRDYRGQVRLWRHKNSYITGDWRNYSIFFLLKENRHLDRLLLHGLDDTELIFDEGWFRS